jgi:hypothetical protein
MKGRADLQKVHGRTFMYRVLMLSAVVLFALAAFKVHRAYAAELRDLHDLDQLRAAVNRDPGAPRIVLLLSPT